MVSPPNTKVQPLLRKTMASYLKDFRILHIGWSLLHGIQRSETFGTARLGRDKGWLAHFRKQSPYGQLFRECYFLTSSRDQISLFYLQHSQSLTWSDCGGASTHTAQSTQVPCHCIRCWHSQPTIDMHLFLQLIPVLSLKHYVPFAVQFW